MEEFKDNRAQSPWRPAARFGIRKSASNSGRSPLRGLGVGLGGGLGDDRGPDRPMAALHFLPPTGHSRSGRSSFDSKLISLLPLDEAPVHVHRFAARAPCDSKGSECQCGIHTAEAASALRSRKTERAAKEKPTPISQFFANQTRIPIAQTSRGPGGSRVNCQMLASPLVPSWAAQIAPAPAMRLPSRSSVWILNIRLHDSNSEAGTRTA